MVARRDERIARFALGSTNPGGRLKSGDDAPQLVEAIAVTDIDPDPEQPRRHFDPIKLQELADSLLSVGQLQPVILVRAGERYRLHVGERRWRAAQLLGLSTIRAIVRATPVEARAARIAQIVENEQRDDLTTTELIDAVRALHADGLKSVDIAAALAKPQNRIAELSALADAPEPLLAVTNAIGLNLSYHLLRQWRAQPEATLDFLAHMPAEHISRVTISTIGQPLEGSRPPADHAQPQAPKVSLEAGRAERGKGASPRVPAQTLPPNLDITPGIDHVRQDHRRPHPATSGALLIEHGEHGSGWVVFGAEAPPDHLAISFDGAAPVVLHKNDVRLLRTVPSSPSPA